MNYGNIALIEGRFQETTKGLLTEFIEENPVTLILEQVYYDHSNLYKLAENNIDTILINEPFAFQDKITDLFLIFNRISKKTGWKPKRLVNAMEYGEEGLYLIANQIGIDFFQLQYNFDGDFEKEQFVFIQVKFSNKDFEFIKMRYNHLQFIS